MAACVSCSPAYVVQQGWGQARILLGRQPVSEVLADPDTPPKTRERLILVGEIREFGGRRLGLAESDNFTLWYDTGGKPITTIVSACAKDSFEGKTWWFPIVGSVPYLGFFDPEDAKAERDRLVADGWDVSIRSASAYSTLGWFSDPVLSTFVDWPVHELADTILHETTHATLWFPGDVATNESFATFVGETGADMFLRERFGPDSPELQESLDADADQKLFRAFMKSLGEALKKVYALDIPTHDKLQMKSMVIARFKQKYRDLKPAFKAKRYQAFDRREWNNALIQAFATYHEGVTTWRRVYEALGSDLKATIELVKSAEKKPNPRAWLEEWLKSREPGASDKRGS